MAKKVGDRVKDFIIMEINENGMVGKCVKCEREYTLPLDRLRQKVCDCNKEVGKYTGQVINGFKVLDGYCKKSKSGNSHAIVYKVQCVECGAISEKYRNCLFNENIECRCDCKKVVRPGDERLYGIWSGMKDRCFNANNTNYHRYGGRGITVCEEWKKDFVPFRDWAWANGYNDSLSIDRVNNDGNYEPTNCRWATREVQANNTSTNHYITINVTTKTIAEWSKITGVPERTIWARLNNGWSEEDALFIPVENREGPMSESRRQKIIAKRGHAVVQCDLDGNIITTYQTVSDAARTMGVDRASIGSALRGKSKTSAGYIWHYIDEDIAA